MRLKSLYNREAVLEALRGHDWDMDPIVSLIGVAESGTTRVADEFISTLLPDQYILRIDCRRITREDEILQNAIAGAREDELDVVKRHLIGAPVAILRNSQLINSKVRISFGGGRRPRRAQIPNSKPAPTANTLVPLLVDDLQSLSRQGWVVVDHRLEALEAVEKVVGHLLTIVERTPNLRALEVLEVDDLQDDIEHWEAELKRTVFVIEPLSPEQLQDWADRLGVNLNPSELDMLFDLTDGRAGRSWEYLSELRRKRRTRGGGDRRSAR